MEIFLTCLKSVLPIFALMAVGYLCQRIGVIRRNDVPAMNKVAFNVFLTCTVFISVYSCDLATTFNPGLMVLCAASTVISFFLASAFVRSTNLVENQRGVMVQGIFRSNFIMVGMQIASSLAGQEGVAALSMLCIVTVPLNNVLAVATLSAHGGEVTSWTDVLLKMLRNPLIIATLLGIALLVCGVHLSSPMTDIVRQMGNVSTPLMLFLLGAFFRFGTLKNHAWHLAIVCAGRLLVIPGLVIAAAWALGFQGVNMVALIAIFASSTANASFTMAQQMNGDAELAGDIVAMTSALCPFTLFLWSFLLMHLGVI